MADDSDGEGFYDDHFEDASDGDDSCGDPFADEEDDDGSLGLCGAPSDEEGDDDSNGEGMCELPCCFDDDDDEDGSDHEDLCVSPHDDDDDGESEEALFDDDDDVEGEGEEEEGNGGELVDDPCDEDDGEEGDGEAQDLCEDPSIDGEEGEREAFCVSGFPTADGSHISDSIQDDSSSSEEEDDELMPIALPTLRTPGPWTIQMLVDSVAVHTDSDDDIDYDSDDTDYDVGEYELHRLPASQAVVESLPEAILSEEDASCGCAVCKDVFTSGQGQRVVSLPCKHYFHGDCIRPWLAIKSTCPVCRYQLPTDDAESRQARQLSVLVPVARHEAQQGGGRDRGDGGGATAGAGDATEWMNARQEVDTSRAHLDVGHGNTQRILSSDDSVTDQPARRMYRHSVNNSSL